MSVTMSLNVNGRDEQKEHDARGVNAVCSMRREFERDMMA